MGDGTVLNTVFFKHQAVLRSYLEDIHALKEDLVAFSNKIKVGLSQNLPQLENEDGDKTLLIREASRPLRDNNVNKTQATALPQETEKMENFLNSLMASCALASVKAEERRRRFQRLKSSHERTMFDKDKELRSVREELVEARKDLEAARRCRGSRGGAQDGPPELLNSQDLRRLQREMRACLRQARFSKGAGEQLKREIRALRDDLRLTCGSARIPDAGRGTPPEGIPSKGLGDAEPGEPTGDDRSVSVEEHCAVPPAASCRDDERAKELEDTKAGAPCRPRQSCLVLGDRRLARVPAPFSLRDQRGWWQGGQGKAQREAGGRDGWKALHAVRARLLVCIHAAQAI
eukprot:CAMPEP_0177599350 /NCGR_PEP_ID=MMETSP0419_2-20121207/12936_1 /TAXON_ID=582737 /ORGANISM="Tetraselmis sp., Strain GSL018" /LENGTH=346 /DNA_ID=CAMNT_0019092057 /DNA_START=280 /DNA_END=1317 /DNA_ORIENTATION=+